MIKVPYEILQFQIENLYSKPFDESDVKGISEHCEFIHDLIISCGYTIDEYLQLMWHDGKIMN